MRAIHKSNQDPTVEDIDKFRVLAIEFQELLYSFKWVPAANQVHRLSHVAFFMQSREVSSIGAFSLEGLEHGNWTTKNLESTRVWHGDTDAGNKQLFRLLRMKGSPTLKRAASLLNGHKTKLPKCSRCKQIGHKRNMRVCPLFGQQVAEESESEGDEEQTLEVELESLDEEGTEASTATDTATEESSQDEDTDNDSDVPVVEENVQERFEYNENLLNDNTDRCDVN